MTQDEWERETLRQMLIGALAIELPAETFEVLKSIYEQKQ